MRRLICLAAALALIAALAGCTNKQPAPELPTIPVGAFAVPYSDFQAGTVADPDEVDANNAAIAAVIGNNNLDSSNYLTTDDTITNSLLNLDSQIKSNADAIASLSTPVVDWTADRSIPVSNDFVGNWPVICFDGSSDTAVWFTFRNPRAGYDYKLKLEGMMDTAEASKAISMNIEYYVVAANGDMTPAAATGSGEDEITTPDDAEERLSHSGVNLKIAGGYLSEANMVILVKLWRDVDGTASNHGGRFCLVNAYLIETEL